MNTTMKTVVASFAFLLGCSQANAQHLWWNLEGENNASCLYGQITVLATAPGIYYCGSNWHPGEPAGGYCGIQHNGQKERRTIFSIWDTTNELHPKTTEADARTVFNRFGGEGEGGHTHMILDWKVGETFQYFVHKEPGKSKDTTDARYYIHDDASGKWRHLATINSPNGGHKSVSTLGGGMNSFLENFTGRNKGVPKVALYRLWLGQSVDKLKSLTRTQGDGTWGQLNDSYFLAEGDSGKLDAVFHELESKYGKPTYGGKGKSLEPISSKPVPTDVLKALENLPRADMVQDQSDEPRDGKMFIIRSVLSRKLLAIEKGSRDEGSKAIQDASLESRVSWKLEKAGDTFRIVNTSNGLVLSAPDGQSVLQTKANQSPNQLWSFIKSGNAYHIRSKPSGEVLDVSGGSTEDGAAVITYSLNLNYSPNQLWMLSEAKN